MNTVKMVVHAKNGVVGVSRFTNNGVKTTLPDTIFETGTSVASFGNVVNALATILESLVDKDNYVEIATIGVVADKINSDMLVKEFWAGKPLGDRRGDYTDDEMNAIERLINSIGATYGKVSFRSEQYITKSTERAKTQDQAEWANLFETVNLKIAESLVEASVPVAKTASGKTEERLVFEDEMEM